MLRRSLARRGWKAEVRDLCDLLVVTAQDFVVAEVVAAAAGYVAAAFAVAWL